MVYRLFLIAGPTGIGKSYLMQSLLQKYPHIFVAPPLITTREPRPNEKAIDRQFVPKAEYDRMLKSGEFMWADSFFGNLYGYTHTAVTPKDRHIIINILPPMVPQFAILPSAVVVGMTVTTDNLKLLEQRLHERGDPAPAVEKRVSGLRQDIKDMADSADIINSHGRLFEITGDGTIPDEVVPYVEGFLNQK